jgi:hypothetical protein
VAAATALGLVVVPASLGGAHAAFSATTANAGDALATAQLQPPAGLTATQSCTSTPTITRRAYSGTVGTTSVSLPLPNGTSQNDVLLAVIAYHDGAETITAPSAWTLLSSASSGTQITSAIYWKAVGPSEPSPVVFSRPAGSTGDMGAALIDYTGARLSAPVVYGSATGVGQTATTPSLSTTGTTTEITHFLTKNQEVLPAPTGTSSIYGGMTSGTTTSEGMTAADETFTGPGSIPVRTSTSATSTQWIAQTVVLRRVAGVPTAHLAWTASPSSWATGYLLDRQVGGSTQTTLTINGASAASTTDGPLTDATAYTYRLTAYRGTWRSSSVTTALTTNC